MYQPLWVFEFKRLRPAADPIFGVRGLFPGPGTPPIEYLHSFSQAIGANAFVNGFIVEFLACEHKPGVMLAACHVLSLSDVP